MYALDLNAFKMKKIINPWLDLIKDGYNCFGCAPTNPDDNYQGWLHTLHGGIQSTLMDEIAAWVVARKLQCAGMTTHLDMKFKRPVPTGPDTTIEIRAGIREMKRNFVFISARIFYDGQVCSEAELTYFCFSAEKSASDFYFRGCETEE